MRYNVLTETESMVSTRSYFMHHTSDARGNKVLKGSLCCLFATAELEQEEKVEK